MDTRVYRFSDYEWVATKWFLEDTVDWYKKEYGTDTLTEEDIENIEECDIDKVGMWWSVEDDETLKKFNGQGYYEEIISDGDFKFGDLMREGCSCYKYIPFRNAMKLSGDFIEPFIIASTEY